MAEKPELSASAGLQNVVVYVSNDNFAQAYTTTNQQQLSAQTAQNVPPIPSQQQQQQQNHSGGATYATTMVAAAPPPHPHPQKCPTLKPNLKQFQQQQTNYAHPNGNGYFPNELYQHQHHHQIELNNYQVNQVRNYKAGSDNPEYGELVDSSYVTVIEGAPTTTGLVECNPATNSLRNCDSVRSEAAESSCSSSSSSSSSNSINDEGIVMLQNHHSHHAVVAPPSSSDMVLYHHNDNSNGLRNGNSANSGGGGGCAVLTVGQQTIATNNNNNQAGTHTIPSPLIGGNNSIPILNAQCAFVTVPIGWKRILNNGAIIYISPSNAVLTCQEQIKEYLLSSGTCKCGLECHFKYDNVFNFDPKVVGKPWTFLNNNLDNLGDLSNTKLCNHKRKILSTVSSLDYNQKPQQIIEPSLKMIKDYNVKRKKRRIDNLNQFGNMDGLPPVLPQLLHRTCPEKLPNFLKESPSNQIWNQQNQQNIVHQFPTRNFTNELNQSVRYPIVAPPSENVENHQMVAAAPSAPSPQQQQVEQHQIPHHRFMNNSPNILIHNHQVISSDGQVINVQKSTNPTTAPPNSVYHYNVPQQQKFQQQQQQRIYVNQPPNEPSGPGRPNMEQHRNHFYSNQPIPSSFEQKNTRPFYNNGFRPMLNQPAQLGQIPQYTSMVNSQKVWHRLPNPNPSVYERVPPLHPGGVATLNQNTSQNSWHEDEIMRKKRSKKNRNFVMETAQSQSCPNIDVRQIQNQNDIVNNRSVQLPSSSCSSHSVPSPAPSFMEDPSGYLAQQTALLNSTINRQTTGNLRTCGYVNCNSPTGISEVPLPSVMMQTIKQKTGKNPAQSGMVPFQYVPDSSAVDKQQIQCSGCFENNTNSPVSTQFMKQNNGNGSGNNVQFSRPNSQPGTPNSDDVTSSSSGFHEKNNEDSRPIQGGTISTSDGLNSGPSTPNPRATPTTPVQVQVAQPTSPYMVQRISETNGGANYVVVSQNGQKLEYFNNANTQENSPPHPHFKLQQVTTMASGRTFGSNTITSVQAGRSNANATTVSTTVSNVISKSPLEMVQSVVSSIQVPNSSHGGIEKSQPQPQPQPSLPAGHILVSSNGQLIMANTNQMPPPPPPPKVVSSSSSSQMVTHMIPTVAQQMLGQQTVLVNALPTPFVLQPGGVTMTMDTNLPQIVAGNLIQQTTASATAIDNGDPHRISPETKKKGGKKRKLQQLQQNSANGNNLNMLQISAAQSQVFQQPSTPVMQALTILPSKNGGTAQFLMNSPNGLLNSQQVNLLQPVNLINSGANFQTIQQFILPNLSAGMVMNPDGTATLLHDANIGMQLQLQNVNGQNILTPVQNSNVFNGAQNIIPGMVIRAPTAGGGKIIQTQGATHSPTSGGAQFLTQTGQFVVNPQFNGQLSPIVAQPHQQQNHQITFRQNSTPNQPEFQQCVMVAPCAPPNQHNSNNTTYVQQNTTIVQQQTTMVSSGQNNNGNNNNQNCRSTNNGNSSGIVQVAAPIILKDGSGYRQSVSTQTATNQSQAVTTNTFCQTSTVCAGSPPDTTTHSPLGGQSPPTVDTTTHSGTPDDGLSPAPSSNVGFTDGRHQSMAMVHCVSSSEPDSASHNSDSECFRQTILNKQQQNQSHEFAEISSGQLNYYHRKSSTSSSESATHTHPQTHFAFAESSTMLSGVHFNNSGAGTGNLNNMKNEEGLVSSRHLDRRKHNNNSGDTLLIMETRQRQLHFDEEDLIWGPTKTCTAWPGKIIAFSDNDEKATVKWFGNEKSTTVIEKFKLQTLSEGLEAHHSARKKIRTSRKLNSQLENAIQEAMRELDKFSEISKSKKLNNNNNLVTSTKSQQSATLACGRLRSQK